MRFYLLLFFFPLGVNAQVLTEYLQGEWELTKMGVSESNAMDSIITISNNNADNQNNKNRFYFEEKNLRLLITSNHFNLTNSLKTSYFKDSIRRDTIYTENHDYKYELNIIDYQHIFQIIT